MGHGLLDPGYQFEEPLGLLRLAKAITRSTPARLYQLRSKITTSPAAGKCGRYRGPPTLAVRPGC